MKQPSDETLKMLLQMLKKTSLPRSIEKVNKTA